MGMSANQARFLSLTSRQVDLEYRMQQICHRRLRLASELEKIATKYNNALSDRRLFVDTLGTTQANGISGDYDFINIPQLAENGLYVLGPSGPAGVNSTSTFSWQSIGSGSEAPSSTDNSGDHFVGEQVDKGGTPATRWTYTSNVKNVITPYAAAATTEQAITYLAPANTTPTSAPSGASTVLDTAVTNSAGLEWVEHETYEKQVDGTYIAQTITSVSITSQTGFNDLIAVWQAGEGLDSNFLLMTDIDMGNAEWAPIGGQGNPAFTGTFDGNGNTVSNIQMNPSAGNVGFFGYANGADIKNLDIENATLNGTGYRNTGILVGYANGCDITNCSTAGTVTGQKQVGGLVGYSISNNIDNCSSSADVTGDFSTDLNAIGQTGGLVGSCASTNIDRSFTTGDVKGHNDTGGLVGYYNTGGSITNSYTTSAVSTYPTTTEEAGGFIGYDTSSGPITDCYASGGSLTSASDKAGGFIGGGSCPASCFYNVEVNGVPEGSTAAEIAAATAGWDDDVWCFQGETGYSDPDGLGSPIIEPDAMGSIQVSTPEQLEVAEWVWNYNVEQEQETVTYTYDGSVLSSEEIEEGLRNGNLYLARHADNYTQEKITFDGVDYEKVDWRTQPVVSDDLYTVNDADAECEYEAAIEKINSQDKKLQLEQSQIEVEHKAIITQKDAVKSILNKNIESSFKTFS